MILQASSEAVTKYGYPLTMQYDNNSFHGTVKGLSIGVVDKEDGEIIDCFVTGDTEREKMEKLTQMIGDKDLLLIEDNITQLVNNKMRSRIMYKIPYCVIEHSAFKPAIVLDNISGASNVTYDVEVEVLMATSEGLNRYLNLNFRTINVPMWELVENYFDEIMDDAGKAEELGFQYYDEDDEESRSGYYLDFYDAAGNMYMEGGHQCLDMFKDYIIGMRLMKLEHCIE